MTDAENEIELQDQQFKQIENEQKMFPLVADRLPFDLVILDYDAETSPDYYNKAKELANTYGEIRQIRGDGNCFYRAVFVGILEVCMKNEEKAKQFLETCLGWNDRLLKLGFPDWTTNDFCEVFTDWFKKVVNKETTSEKIFDDLNDDSQSNYLIIFMRLITSGYLKEHSEDYAPFIDDGRSLADYCSTEIEAMWKDADHLGISGLVLATGYNIRIEYMDRTAAPNGGWHYDIPADCNETPEISLLYRPGHYDIIYHK
ncbi:unnamed protein product [Caenorhabditis angaria]|uniref:ubiquitinyl hydrolase 1 n=1 Tax=Caenorhabditis angaria TaxID=860376 RepID=A0A9P1IYG0_9PELO|nr:unnamed protein product [Caenorhabditis angaria]